MPIDQKNGHWALDYSPSERFHKSFRNIDKYTQEEFEMAHWLNTSATVEELREVLSTQFDEKIMPISQWLRSEHHVGSLATDLYPTIRKSLEEIFKYPCWTHHFSEVILTGGTGYGKCLVGDTEVFNSVSGRREKLSESSVVRTATVDINEEVDSGTGRFSFSNGTASKTGYKRCLEVLLAGGQRVQPSVDHKFLTHKGYVRAEDLTTEHLVAVPRRLPEPEKTLDVTKDELITEVERLAVNVNSDVRLRADFYSLSNEDITFFLSRLSSFHFVHIKISRYPEVNFKSVCSGLARDISYLLLRLGINGRIFERDGCFDLMVSGSNVLDFIKKIPVWKRKAELSKKIKNMRPLSSHRDIVPISADEVKIIKEEVKAAGGRWGREGKRDWVQRSSFMGRDRFKRLCEKYNYQGQFAWLANTDILWERFKSSRDIGWHDVYDISISDGPHNFVANLVCVHNSTCAKVIIMRVLYELLCLKNPQASLGMALGSKIYITPMAHRAETAHDIVFGELLIALQGIPWFKERLGNSKSQTEIKFRSKNIYIKGGSSSDGALLGLSIFLAIIDEGNFFGKAGGRGSAHGKRAKVDEVYDKAQQVFDAVTDRVSSRFTGDLSKGNKKSDATGMVVVSSSKRGTNDFTERRARQARKALRNNKECLDFYILDKPSWVDFDVSESETFRIVAWSENGPPRIVPNDYKPTGNEIIHDIPKLYEAAFRQDPETFLRNKVGVATPGIDPYFTQSSRILAMMSSSLPAMFNKEVHNDDDAKELEILFDNFMVGREPRYNPEAQRHAHIDMSATRCSTGLSIGYLGPIVRRARKDIRGNQEVTFVEDCPLYLFDGHLQFDVPKSTGSISIPAVREVIYRLRDGGLPIYSVSMDQWNYETNKHEFEAHGFKVFRVSSKESGYAYDLARNAIYDGRARSPYHSRLKVELNSLMRDKKGNATKSPVNVDGTPGSQDVSDAFVGVIKFLYQSYSAEYTDIPHLIQGREDPARLSSLISQAYADPEIARRNEEFNKRPAIFAQPETIVTVDDDDEDEDILFG